MRFGPEHRPDLVDPLEDPDQHLLEELRALGQVRRPAEVVDLEDVGAALGRRLHELGRGHLGEPAGVEGVAEPLEAGGRELPLGPLERVPPGDRRVVEHDREAGVQRGPPQLDGRGVGVVGQRRHRRLGHLDAAGGLRVGGRRPDHLDGRLLGRYVGLAANHHLGEPGAVADDQERELGQLAPPVHPALQADGLARRGRGQVRTERAFHGTPPVGGKPWRCGRGQSRGATTPSPMCHRPLVGTPDARTPASRGLSGPTGVGHQATDNRVVC